MRKMEPSLKMPAPPGNVLPPRRPAPLETALFNERGFRAGWPVALFLLLTYFLQIVFGSVAWATGTASFHLRMDHFGVGQEILEELAALAALFVAALIASRMDGRRLPSYFLIDPKPFRHALTGAVAGFLALSALAGTLCIAGWLSLSYAQQSSAAGLRFAFLWGIAFLLVALTEEGTFRCFLLGTLMRGMNFWWALGTLSLLVAFLLFIPDHHGAAGVYASFLIGVGPCLWIHMRRLSSSQFWQAAWTTSTAFGFVHTFNSGETAVGIFSAALIGFTFCVSLRLTGSAWWAIGFHSAWDWAQTYFYGTPDSGLIPQGSFLHSNAIGPVLWSGGKAGPEGSILVIPATLLVLGALIFVYRSRTEVEARAAVEPA